VAKYIFTTLFREDTIYANLTITFQIMCTSFSKIFGSFVNKKCFFNYFCGMPSEMANNDRKHIPRFVAPRCGAMCYGFFFLSLFTSYGGIPPLRLSGVFT